MQSPSAPDARRQTVQQSVLSALRKSIVSGDLAPGSLIRQDALAAQLGVSRVPLREALKILEGEGVVAYRPRRGFLIVKLSVPEIREIYRLRELLETEAARVAVDLASEAAIDDLADAVRQLSSARAAGDAIAIGALNRELHFQLFELSEMPRLVRLVRTLWDATDAYRFVYYRQPESWERIERRHLSVVEALRARDADRLIGLLDEHREYGVDELCRILPDEPVPLDM